MIYCTYQVFLSLKWNEREVWYEVMSGNLKQATLKTFGFTQRVEHLRGDIDVCIPDYVNKTGLVCPDC